MIMLFDQQYATEAYARNEAAKAAAEGVEKGERQGILSTLSALVRDGVLKKEEAAERAKMSVAEFEEESKKLE